jgi:hypothetical protein
MKASPLKTCFDEIEETNGDDECRAWLSKAFDAKLELAAFVASHRPGRVTEYVGFLKGSFNFCFRYRFDDDGPDAIIRFPKPGHTATALRDEKVTNEVQAMEYLRRNTTIPIPRVHGWGLTAESPQKLGPFIIMDFVEGMLLSEVLQTASDYDRGNMVLDAGIDNSMLDVIYLQIAEYLLQLSRITFSRIGAIFQDGDGWSVDNRPLTYNMNELATVANYPPNLFPASAFDRTSNCLRSLAEEHLAHLDCQRNLADDEETARARFIARHRFAQLIPQYCVDDAGPFLPFCDDLRPSNMLINPDTFQITAVLDLEYTNAMPAQFSYDPPWWLLLSSPGSWIERDALEEFKASYEPRMEQFLRAMEAAEEVQGLEGPRLSARVLEDGSVLLRLCGQEEF